MIKTGTDDNAWFSGHTPTEYLCVDAFIKNVVDARALATAFELGLIDYFDQNPVTFFNDLRKRFKTDERGLRVLLIEENRGRFNCSPQFRKALQYRDLMESKLDFANQVSPDFTDFFTALISNPDWFFRNARIFDLFAYNRCFESSLENYKKTKRWMRITTMLTRYEALACMNDIDFSCYHQILDIGGNSGEFVLQICKKHPGILATVFDLPLVCDIGEEHLRSEPEVDRIKFIKGNALTDALPTGFDLISFKSMLHDWPDKEAGQLILNARRSLKDGGTLLIFERGPLEVVDDVVPYSMIPFLLFFRSYRSPEFYENVLKNINFTDIKVKKIILETPFYMITAKT
jgi:SAM-dependent methyltransferase